MSHLWTDQAFQALVQAVHKPILAATTKDAVQLARSVNSLADKLTDIATGLPWPEYIDALQTIVAIVRTSSGSC
jgi:hypothetical protein